MSTQRFTLEFKSEAVRQVIERGYSVAEIADFSSLKKERIRKKIYKTRDMTHADVFDTLRLENVYGGGA